MRVQHTRRWKVERATLIRGAILLDKAKVGGRAKKTTEKGKEQAGQSQVLGTSKNKRETARGVAMTVSLVGVEPRRLQGGGKEIRIDSTLCLWSRWPILQGTEDV